LPPTFPLVHFDYQALSPGEYFAHAVVEACSVGQLSYAHTFTAYNANGVAMVGTYSQPWRRWESLPPGFNLNGATGEVTCTFSSGDAYQVYNFYIMATETATGQFDLLHVVLQVSVEGQGSNGTEGSPTIGRRPTRTRRWRFGWTRRSASAALEAGCTWNASRRTGHSR
jgi:hypothetical protein